jgi:hypothetical protein
VQGNNKLMETEMKGGKYSAGLYLIAEMHIYGGDQGTNITFGGR